MYRYAQRGLLRALLTSRKVIQRKCNDLENEIRSLLKVFGMKLPLRLSRGSFEIAVRDPTKRRASGTMREHSAQPEQALAGQAVVTSAQSNVLPTRSKSDCLHRAKQRLGESYCQSWSASMTRSHRPRLLKPASCGLARRLARHAPR